MEMADRVRTAVTPVVVQGDVTDHMQGITKSHPVWGSLSIKPETYPAKDNNQGTGKVHLEPMHCKNQNVDNVKFA